MDSYEVLSFCERCAEKLAAHFLLDGKPTKAQPLSEAVGKAVDDVLSGRASSVEIGGILVAETAMGVGVYLSVGEILTDHVQEGA